MREPGTGPLAVAVWLTCSSLSAQTVTPIREFIPDRPDFTESTEVVGHGTLRVESGLRVEQLDGREVRADVLLRVGLGTRFEIRAAGYGVCARRCLSSCGADWLVGAGVAVRRLHR